MVPWLQDIDTAKDLTDLNHSGYWFTNSAMELETLDAEIEKGIIAILSKEFRRQVQLKEELSGNEGVPVLTWRQIARVIYQQLFDKGKMLDYIDFLNLSLVDLKAFEHSWDEALMADIQPERELENLFYCQ